MHDFKRFRQYTYLLHSNGEIVAILDRRRHGLLMFQRFGLVDAVYVNSGDSNPSVPLAGQPPWCIE
jgi:hypothetical protein